MEVGGPTWAPTQLRTWGQLSPLCWQLCAAELHLHDSNPCSISMGDLFTKMIPLSYKEWFSVTDWMVKCSSVFEFYQEKTLT